MLIDIVANFLQVARCVIGQLNQESHQRSRRRSRKPCDDIGSGLHLTSFDLTATQRENLEQRNRFLHLLVAVDIPA